MKKKIMNSFIMKRRQKSYPERNFGTYNMESEVLPRDETHTIITKIIKIKKSNFDGQMTEILKSLRMPQRMLAKCSTSQWRKMDTHAKVVGDNDEEMTSTENVSGLRKCCGQFSGSSTETYILCFSFSCPYREIRD